MTEPERLRLLIVRQCDLVSISGPRFFRRSAGETLVNLNSCGWWTRSSWISLGTARVRWRGTCRPKVIWGGRKRVWRLMARLGQRRSASGHAGRCRIRGVGYTRKKTLPPALLPRFQPHREPVRQTEGAGAPRGRARHRHALDRHRTHLDLVTPRECQNMFAAAGYDPGCRD